MAQQTGCVHTTRPCKVSQTRPGEGWPTGPKMIETQDPEQPRAAHGYRCIRPRMCDTAKRASITHTGVCVIQVYPKYPVSEVSQGVKYPKDPINRCILQGFPGFSRVISGLSRVILGGLSRVIYSYTGLSRVYTGLSRVISQTRVTTVNEGNEGYGDPSCGGAEPFGKKSVERSTGTSEYGRRSSQEEPTMG